jgi:predicted Zn-dependent protease
MLARSHRSPLASVLALALLIPMLAPTLAAARGRTTPQDKKDNKAPKEQQPKLTKEEKEYQKIKKFATDLYFKDADFRDAVEDEYMQMQRKHSEYAYYLNTRNPALQMATWEGDKPRVEYALYDNPLAQDYVNRVGQSLVPSGSIRLYTFRILLNPIPESRALSTGTVYISTGLLSVIDNEAQLAYVLGHEIGHVEKEHWKEDVLVIKGAKPYNEKQAQKRALWGSLIGLAGAAAGAAIGGGDAAASGFWIAYNSSSSVLKSAMPNAITSWDRIQEDEADAAGLKYSLDRNYDIREVPKFYANLRRTSSLDPRVRLGFIADKDRIGEREEQVKSLIGNSNVAQKSVNVGASDLSSSKALNPSDNSAARADAANRSIAGSLSPELKAKLDAGELIGNSAEFEAVMAGITRDNGIRAYYFDMFRTARENLEESLRIRSNDPYSHYYYGKILKLTARTSQEKLTALAEFAKAIDLDKRRVIAEPYLYRALSLIDTKDSAQTQEIVGALKDYVAIYQREHAGALPPNMEVIYDYMQEAGEVAWAATPAMNVSTRGIEPIGAKLDTPAPRPSVQTDSQPSAPATQLPTQRPTTKRRP